MGWRGTALLALLVVLVAAYVWLEDVGPNGRQTLTGESPPQVVTTPTRHLLHFRPADVVALRLEREGHVHEVRRAAGAWQGVGNPTALDDLTRDLADLGVLMEIPGSQAALKDYGLQPPRGSLEISLRDQPAPLSLQIGDRNPATTGVYVRTDIDGPVLLAGALIEWDFDRAFEAAAGQP